MLKELAQKLQETIATAEATNSKLSAKENGLNNKEELLNKQAEAQAEKAKELGDRETKVSKIEDLIAFRNETNALAQKTEEDRNQLNKEKIDFEKRISLQLQEVNNQKAANEAEEKRLAKLAEQINQDKLKYKEQVLKELSINITMPK